ncbi:DUF397 domain-containing protein [Streptomyces aidingensis]|uniref:DUF397 domain-containing protein n=1 Tax=Streptomyces aidingensis TaxID=910347 RepID=UPI000B8168DB|nr:DUF397 domain-containing protein [Streptomyces aidingensis]
MKPTTDSPWRKSSYSGADNGQCLEVRDDVPGAIPVRDSKRPHHAPLTIPHPAWQTFLTLVR